MNLEKLKNLPLQERIAEFKKIRSKFASEKNQLNDIIGKLEGAVKEREAVAQNLSVSDRKVLKNEVKALAQSIKNVKARLIAKSQELGLVEKALAEAEQNIVHDERLFAEMQKQEKTKLEMMITELKKINETRELQQLEEEIRHAEIPEEVKKEVEHTADYMNRQNENFYKAEMNQFMEETAGYQARKQPDEDAKPTLYETAEQAKRKKELREDYK
jgi:hypothetical protein